MDSTILPIAIVALEVTGVLGLGGIFFAWRIITGRQKLKARELEIEAMRIANESRALEIESRRLELALDESALKVYTQLPR